jgi:hypothetical protein
MAYREVTEAYPEMMETNPEEMKSVVPKEKASVKTARALKEQYGGRHLAVRHR